MKTFLILLMTLSSVSMFGQDWTPKISNTTYDLNKVDFPSPQVGYAVGDSMTFLKTVDGGETWNQIIIPDTFPIFDWNYYFDIVTVEFINELEGRIAFNFSGHVLHTTNGGWAWEVEEEAVNNAYESPIIHFENDTSGLIVGTGPFGGYYLTKYGENGWDSFWNISDWLGDFDCFGPVINDIDFYDELGYMVTDCGLLLKSVDYGYTWETIEFDTELSLLSIHLVSDSIIYLTTSEPWEILRSSDAGNTWEMNNNNPTFAYPTFNDIWIESDSLGFAIATASANTYGVIKTLKNGLWDLYTTVDNPILNSVTCNGPNCIIVGGDGLILKRTIEQTNATNSPLANDARYKIFPNPSSLLLQHNFPLENLTQMEIYTIHGQLITTYTPSNQIDIEQLPKGVYLIQLHYQDQIVSKKFIKS